MWKRLLTAMVCMASLLWAANAEATNYTLWIHGRDSSGSGQIGNYDSWGYWGNGATAAGINKKSVNWAGTQSIATTNGTIREALDCFCTGTNWCYINVHSAGNVQIGYALSLYGGSSRTVKNATPNASGVCGSTGATQTGWNIKWVNVASGAGGGTELADVGSWASSEPLVPDLKTSTARGMYDHNQTRGRMFYMFAGASGTLYSAVLPGQDDEVVAYHSTGGVSGASGAGFCNPSDWWCNDLNLGTAACEGGAAKWSNHSTALRDDGEVYTHYSAQGCSGPCWGGIIGPVRNDAVTYAK